MIDGGVNLLHIEFANGNIIKRLFAGDAGAEESGDDHGAYITPKVCGVVTGVSKKASIIIVKIKMMLSSTLDGFAKVMQDLRSAIAAGRNVKGYTVITLSRK